MTAPPDESISVRIPWAEFLGRHDLVWDRIPRSWGEGAFVGNGLLGAMIYAAEPKTNGANSSDRGDVLGLDLGRSDVTDHHFDLSEHVTVSEGTHRFLIGRMRLATVGRPVGGSTRLDLWNAEARGEVITDRGKVTWRCIAHASLPVLMVETVRDGDEVGAHWEFAPAEAISPHVIHRRLHQNEPNAQPIRTNPRPQITVQGAVQVCVQPLSAGGEFATAWREEVTENRRRGTLFVSIGDSRRTGGGEAEAIDAVEHAAAQGSDRLSDSHRNWWHAYWPESFVSLPDARLESFYWIQIYKMASAMRADRPMCDLMGPWPAITVWPGIWWNLNVQLTYWPVYASNRLHLGEGLCRDLDRGTDAFIRNVPASMAHDSAAVGVQTGRDFRQDTSVEISSLLWVCHNYWLQWRCSMDLETLARLYPLLRRSVCFFLHLLREDAEGILHVPETRSPEYPTRAEDTTICLALLRWGCVALQEADTLLGKNDPLRSRWSEVLDRLAPYPVDPDTGFMIGKGVPLAESHRHFSHLMMVHPLYVLDPTTPENRLLVEKSLRHWVGFEGALQGYTFSGAASLAASLGDGDASWQYLDQMIDRFIQPNTMYLEWSSPVLETPLSGAASVHGMLLQSWGGILRVFPAVPAQWRDVVVHQLRGEGAFLVSACREGGQTRWVRVRSLAGEPCRVKTDMTGDVTVAGVTGSRGQDGTFTLEMQAGQEALLYPAGTTPRLVIEPVTAAAAITERRKANWFGSHSADLRHSPGHSRPGSTLGHNAW